MPGSIMSPSCAISIVSTEISFFDASRSGPSHLQIQPLTKTHLANEPFGPSCVIVPLKRSGVRQSDNSSRRRLSRSGVCVKDHPGSPVVRSYFATVKA